MTYEEALDYIASLAPRGWRLGLDRMAEFARRAGLADVLGGPAGPQYIHITGTNGKGTVTAFVQSILREHGLRTGAFYSPYVVNPRERIQVGWDLIPKQKLADLTERLIPVAESFTEADFGGVTEFEFKTALGFLYWKERACEWVALEVGLGGRLDSTNIITPAACVISSIGLDHVSVLGPTHADIAGEKAGIIKVGAPVVVGPMPEEAETVIRGVAVDVGAPVLTFGREVRLTEGSEGFRVETPVRSYGRLEPGLRGKYVGQNMALAMAAIDAAGIELDADAVARGVRAANVPGRFEQRTVRGRQVVLDGAHNADAAHALMETVGQVYSNRRVVLLTGMVQGHDPLEFYAPFVGSVKSVHVAPIDFHRAVPAPELEQVLRPLFGRTAWHESVQAATEGALEDVSPEDLLLVTGSFYLVGEVLRSLD